MEKATVKDWLTSTPITIDADVSIIEALHLMRERGSDRGTVPLQRRRRMIRG
ncbi:MAG: hypothetical protein ABI837_14070 [Acidobacteriota bacterium]